MHRKAHFATQHDIQSRKSKRHPSILSGNGAVSGWTRSAWGRGPDMRSGVRTDRQAAEWGVRDLAQLEGQYSFGKGR